METSQFTPSFLLTNKNATSEAKAVMEFLKSIHGKKIISGEHCNKCTCPDVEYIKRIIGKTPALIGFDLLSYSGAIDTPDSSWECIDEISNNKWSIEAALRWGKEKAIISFCWHWFSPNNGRDKSFYTDKTDFNLAKALENENSDDFKSLVRDLDMIEEQLKILKNAKIPVLWRPLHEAEGGWFWWGASGADAYIKLYRLMYERFTNLHKLDNLIWVWNAPKNGWYPGDDVVDISSLDNYNDKIVGGTLKADFEELIKIPTTDKPAAIGEIGSIPNLSQIESDKIPWLWYMLWCGFAADPEWNTIKSLQEGFNHPYTITLEDLKENPIY